MLPAYRRLGSGPVLVCHPGGPGFSSAEFGDLAGLEDSLSLVLVDPRGTGGSPPAPSYTLDDYASDLEELRIHLGAEQLDLLGFSHGGLVAMHYAALRPERVRRLVAASTLAAFTPEMAEEAERVKAAKSGEPWYPQAAAALEAEDRGEYDDAGALWKAMAPLYFSTWSESYRPWLEGSADGAAAAPLREFNATPFDIRAELPRIAAETLVLAGRDDFICGPAAAATIAAGIRGARVVLLPGCGHMTFVEQPGRFRDELLAFLSA